MGSSGVRQWGDFASVYGEFLLSVDRSRLSGPVSVVSGTWETRWQEVAEEVERWRKKAQDRWGFRNRWGEASPSLPAGDGPWRRRRSAARCPGASRPGGGWATGVTTAAANSVSPGRQLDERRLEALVREWLLE